MGEKKTPRAPLSETSKTQKSDKGEGKNQPSWRLMDGTSSGGSGAAANAAAAADDDDDGDEDDDDDGDDDEVDDPVEEASCITARVALIAPARAVGEASTTAGAVAAVAIAGPGTGRGARELPDIKDHPVATLVNTPRIVVSTAVDSVEVHISIPVVRALGDGASADLGEDIAGAEGEVRERVVETCTTTEGDIAVVAASDGHRVLEAPGVLLVVVQGVGLAQDEVQLLSVSAVAGGSSCKGDKEGNGNDSLHEE